MDSLGQKSSANIVAIVFKYCPHLYSACFASFSNLVYLLVFWTIHQNWFWIFRYAILCQSLGLWSCCSLCLKHSNLLSSSHTHILTQKQKQKQNNVLYIYVLLFCFHFKSQSAEVPYSQNQVYSYGFAYSRHNM